MADFDTLEGLIIEKGRPDLIINSSEHGAIESLKFKDVCSRYALYLDGLVYGETDKGWVMNPSLSFPLCALLQMAAKNIELEHFNSLKKHNATVKFFSYQSIGGSRYNVFNQNGFNNALYNAVGCAENDGSALFSTKKELRESITDYPKSYPCTVSFEDKMLECGRVYVSIKGIQQY